MIITSRPTIHPLAVVSNDVPIGTIVLYAGTDTPDGWIACDNASYPITTYPKLYAAIGYMSGMGGTNYRVPDARYKPVGGIGAILRTCVRRVQCE